MKKENWTYEKCYNCAKDCTCRKEFHDKYSKAYHIALKNKWLDDYTWFESSHHAPWTEDETYIEALKYNSRSEFQKGSRGAYKAAINHGWIERYTWFTTPKKYNQIWTKELCELEARKYVTLSEFRKGNKSAFSAAYNHGWITGFDWLAKKEAIWYYESCYEEAKKYTCIKDFQKGSAGACDVARKNGWFKEYTWFKHPKNYNQKWDYETCYEEAKKYTCRKQLCDGTPGAYHVALKNGWLDDYVWFQKPENYNKKWNYKTCYDEAKKYTKIVDFMKTSFGAYDVARQNDWLKDYTWMPRQLKEWTYDSCYTEAQKYKSKHEFEKGCSSAYVTARKKGWLNNYTWFERPEVYNKIWHKDECFEVARQYESQRDFKEGNKSAYGAARNNNWLKEMTWFIPAKLKEYDSKKTNYVVYVYKDYLLHVAYVGLTTNLKARHSQHKNKENDTLHKYYTQEKCQIPDPIVLEEGLSAVEAQYYENFYLNKFNEEGWIILNKAKTGVFVSSIGGGYIRYTYDKAFEIAKKYTTIESFRQNDKKWYQKSYKKGWITDFTWLEYKHIPPYYWNEDRILVESSKYKSAKDFRKHAIGAYTAAKNSGLLEKLVWEENSEKIFTDELIFEESKNYKTLEDYKINSPYYNMARSRKLLNSMIWLERKHRVWNSENIITESKKYKTVKDFRTKANSAYLAAKKYNLLSEMTWLEKTPPSNPPHKTYWTEERIYEEGKKYKDMKSFRLNSPKAYGAAKRLKILNKMDWLIRMKNQFSTLE